MNVRRINADEGPEFLGLWFEYLKETKELGGEIIPSERTLIFFAEMVQTYTMEPTLGVALATVNGQKLVGCLLWGALPPVPIDTEFGKIAHGFGTYVLPSYRLKGLSAKMREAAKDLLAAEGFETVLGTAGKGNTAGLKSAPGAGFVAYGTSCALNLVKGH